MLTGVCLFCQQVHVNATNRMVMKIFSDVYFWTKKFQVPVKFQKSLLINAENLQQ